MIAAARRRARPTGSASRPATGSSRSTASRCPRRSPTTTCSRCCAARPAALGGGDRSSATAKPIRMHFSIERAKIPIESVPYAYMIQPGVGYVRIIRFAADHRRRAREGALSTLRQQGMKSLMLDLRGNYGGLLSPGGRGARTSWCRRTSCVVYTRGRITSANAGLLHQRARQARRRADRGADRPRHAPRASEIVAGAIRTSTAGWCAASTRSARAWSRTSSGSAMARSCCSRSPSTTRRAAG